MTETYFVDTNILVYYRDGGEREKQPIAKQWLKKLWSLRAGRLSVQVLNEFYVTVTQKLKPGMPVGKAWRDIELLMAWQPQPLNMSLLRHAHRIQERFEFSWWDSLAVAAAQIQECDILLSEDLQDGQQLDSLRVVNPFANPAVLEQLPTTQPA